MKILERGELLVEQLIRHTRMTPFVLIRWGLMLTIAFMLQPGATPSSSEELATVQQMFQILGAVLLGITALNNVLRGGIHLLIDRLIAWVFAISLISWMIGETGDDIQRWVSNNPSEAKYLLVVFMLMVITERLANYFSASESTMDPEPYYAIAQLRNTPEPSRQDYALIAAHEAGHALVFSALEELPEGFFVSIGSGTEGSIGRVRHKEEHVLKTESRARWYMLLYLAGHMGEQAAFGTASLGSDDDIRKWQQIARTYLLVFSTHPYYASPESDAEVKTNNESLKTLRSEQESILKVLFDQNQEVFNEMRIELLKAEEMDAEQIAPYLQRVKLPEGFRPHHLDL